DGHERDIELERLQESRDPALGALAAAAFAVLADAVRAVVLVEDGHVAEQVDLAGETERRLYERAAGRIEPERAAHGVRVVVTRNDDELDHAHDAAVLERDRHGVAAAEAVEPFRLLAERVLDPVVVVIAVRLLVAVGIAEAEVEPVARRVEQRVDAEPAVRRLDAAGVLRARAEDLHDRRRVPAPAHAGHALLPEDGAVLERQPDPGRTAALHDGGV